MIVTWFGPLAAPAAGPGTGIIIGPRLGAESVDSVKTPDCQWTTDIATNPACRLPRRNRGPTARPGRPGPGPAARPADAEF